MTDELIAEIKRLNERQDRALRWKRKMTELYDDYGQQVRALNNQLLALRSSAHYGVRLAVGDAVWGTDELRQHFKSDIYKHSLPNAPEFCGRVAYVGSIYGDDMCRIQSTPDGVLASSVGAIPLAIMVRCRIAYLERDDD